MNPVVFCRIVIISVVRHYRIVTSLVGLVSMRGSHLTYKASLIQPVYHHHHIIGSGANSRLALTAHYKTLARVKVTHVLPRRTTGWSCDHPGSRKLVIDVSITHDRIRSSTANFQLNGTLSHPNTPDAPLNEAAGRKLNKYCKTTCANIHSISFLPAINSTSARMHGEFLRLLFLLAHRETEAYFAFMGTPAQPDQDQFRFRRAAFYSSL
jgi:hypothetical protein